MPGGPDRYATYVASGEYRTSRVTKARVIAHLCGDYLRAPARVADLGSGTGLVKRELELIAQNKMLGIELDRSFMEDSSRTLQADATRLPIRSGGLDFVLLNHVYEHVGDQVALFAEAYRVLARGGRAYVAAGSRLAIIEPHYRLPFLSWLPARTAGSYLRRSGRGTTYDGIHFLTYRPLRRRMRSAGFVVHDITERAIDELIDTTWGRGWGGLWRLLGMLPGKLRSSLLRSLSPQWFFLLEKPGGAPGREGNEEREKVRGDGP